MIEKDHVAQHDCALGRLPLSLLLDASDPSLTHVYSALSCSETKRQVSEVASNLSLCLLCGVDARNRLCGSE